MPVTDPIADMLSRIRNVTARWRGAVAQDRAMIAEFRWAFPAAKALRLTLPSSG